MKAIRPSALGLLGILLLAAGSPAVAELALIGHPTIGDDRLTLNTTRRIFSMQLDRWPDGMPVRVFVMPDNTPQHRAFAKNRLRLFPRQLRRVWDRQLYTGTGQAPEIVASEAQMLRRVAETPGAVGYLSSENLDDSVRTIEIR